MKRTTRLLLISDTHVPADRVPQVISIIGPLAKGCERILHAGDIACTELLDALAELAPVDAVFGNMDPEPVRQRLSEQRILSIQGRSIGLIHGWGSAQDLARRVAERFTGPDGSLSLDALVYGHSHAAAIEHRHGVLVVNPGSPIDKRFAPFRSVAYLHLGEKIEAEIVKLRG